MPQVINTNTSSLNTQRNLAKIQLEQSTAVQRLSSGLRVNTAKDDAAGLAIATRMEAQSRGMSVAVRNVNDGISALQVADGALSAVTANLQRMRELSIQALNGTNTSSDIGAIQKEFSQLDQANREIFLGTSFNGAELLSFNGYTGTAPNVWRSEIQIGPNVTDRMEISVFPNADTDQFGDFVNYPGYNGMILEQGINQIDFSLTETSKGRATIGAQLSRLDGIIANLQIANENTTAARGRIMDADYAAETASLTRAQILQNAGTAMMAQANSQPQQVLNLLPR